MTTNNQTDPLPRSYRVNAKTRKGQLQATIAGPLLRTVGASKGDRLVFYRGDDGRVYVEALDREEYRSRFSEGSDDDS